MPTGGKMKPFSFYLITDTHYFAPSLGCSGEAYDEFMQSEQKCFAETAAINKAAMKWLAEAKDADTILIPGDLSFNGEKLSHLEFIELLKTVKAAGKRILVITAGHDYNLHPFCFDENGRGEPEGTPREELYDLYYEFGFSDALSVDRKTLSYVSQLAPGIRLLALNNDGNYANHRTFTPAQVEWILQQTKKAREDGQMMIAINHYPMIPATPFFSLIGDAVMPNYEEMTNLLADEGVHVVFTGHMHNQSIKRKESPAGNTFWDVCTGSLIGCPAYMRHVTIESAKTLDIKSIPVPPFEWNFGGLTQEEYLQRQFDMMIGNYLKWMEDDPVRFMRKVGLGDSDSVKKIVAPVGKWLNNVTLGDICNKMLVPCPEEVSEMQFCTLAQNIVRNLFVGNAPYVEGTPEYSVIMGVLGRVKPLLAAANAALSKNGKKVDIADWVKVSIGNYGVDEYNTRISW